jgi:hypothetical protein
MKTEQQLKAALAKLRWYVASPRIMRQDILTRNNIAGVLAALEWLAGQEQSGGVVGHTLEQIGLMQQADARTPGVN